MLNKRFRFHSRGGVNYVYKNGTTLRGSKVSLVHCENKRGYTRVTVVVSKKISKKAVIRNRIRRRVYSAVEKNLDLLPKKRDYIFSVRSKRVLRMDFAELEKILGELVENSKVCYDRSNG